MTEQTVQEELFTKVYAENAMPRKQGVYTTNFGELKFEDGTFWIKGSKGYHKTVIEWWMNPLN